MQTIADEDKNEAKLLVEEQKIAEELAAENARKKDEEDWDNWMDESQKELQQIFQGQSAMKEVLTEMDRKMNDIINRQERAFNAISTIRGGGAVPQGTGQPQIAVGDSIRRDEVNAILANQREIVSASRDLK